MLASLARPLVLRAFAWLVQREAAVRFASSREPYSDAAEVLVSEALDLVP